MRHGPIIAAVACVILVGVGQAEAGPPLAARACLADAAKTFWYWPAGLALIVVLIGVLTVALVRLKRRLTRSQNALRVHGDKRVEVEAALRQSNQQLDRFFSLSIDMLCLADMETGCFLRVNNACERTLGYSLHEMTGLPWIDLVHPEDREQTLAAAGTLAEGKPIVHFENRYRCKDGTYKWLAWSSVSVIQEGIIYAVARDVTDHKAAEWQLQEQNRKLAELLRVGRGAR